MRDRVVDDRYRSILQKAVRRGHTELVYTVSALIESLGPRSSPWFERRTAAIVLSECWPLGREVAFTKGFHSKVAALIEVAGACKARDAAGLGFLAYALARGDSSVLGRPAEELTLKRIAQGIRHPVEFWDWIADQPADERGKVLALNASRYKEGGRPHDRAVVQAAAYLAVCSSWPEIEPAPAAGSAFPFWVVFDRHTAEGKRALQDIARDLHIPLPQLEWSFFFFEGAIANADVPSPWWQRYCQWRFDRISLRKDEAPLVWEPAKIQVAEALAEESLRLQADIYRWKLSHLERVETLKRQVELFASRIHTMPRNQPKLF